MDWKILSALLVAIVIIISGFIGSNIELPGFGDIDFKDLTGNFLNSNQNTTKNIIVNAEIYGDGKIKFRNANFLKLAEISSSNIVIGNEKLNLFSSDLIITGFIGNSEVNIKEKNIFIDGTARTIVISGTSIIPQPNRTISIKGYVTYDSAIIKNIGETNSILINADTGSLKINNESAVLNIDNTLSDIGNFAGDIELTKIIKLTGKTNKISVSGNLNIEIK